MQNAMKSTIDQAGRLVIPRELRRAAGLEPGMPLEVRLEGGAVIIEPSPLPVTLERRSGFVIARASAPVPKLKEQTVRETRERLRSERGAAGEPKKG
jgi:AbrB family looped-hinge helix DNA binding protein